jgi:hypothetical protein
VARIEVVLRQHQLDILRSMEDARFGILVCHRRFGKTYFSLWWLLLTVMACTRERPRGYYFCPTYQQAKRVAWDYLKAFTAQIPGVQYNEAELRVDFGQRRIQLGSADNPDASRGIYADAVVLDEPAQMPSQMWTQIIRPALSDRIGKALFIGTPAGRTGLLYETWERADQDGWASHLYKASETGIIDDAELKAARGLMTQAEFDQEFEVSWDAAVRGAYFAEAMQKAAVAKYQVERDRPVHIAMDLGISDATACWFYQVDGNSATFVDYAEYTNMGLADIVHDWRERGYVYGKVVAPHDVEVRSLSTGMTRKQTLQQLGCDVINAPNVGLMDGIEVTRSFLMRCSFDRDKCKDGIEALRQYRSDWQDKKGVLALRPLHDWTSHAADAMRYAAITGLSALTGGWGGDIDYKEMDRRCA